MPNNKTPQGTPQAYGQYSSYNAAFSAAPQKPAKRITPSTNQPAKTQPTAQAIADAAVRRSASAGGPPANAAAEYGLTGPESASDTPAASPASVAAPPAATAAEPPSPKTAKAQIADVTNPQTAGTAKAQTATAAESPAANRREGTAIEPQAPQGGLSAGADLYTQTPGQTETNQTQARQAGAAQIALQDAAPAPGPDGTATQQAGAAANALRQSSAYAATVQGGAGQGTPAHTARPATPPTAQPVGQSASAGKSARGITNAPPVADVQPPLAPPAGAPLASGHAATAPRPLDSLTPLDEATLPDTLAGL